MMTNEAIEKYKPMSPAEVVAQVRLVQDVMEAVMKKDEHYGTIPGTDKPTLLKPGAEKLSMTFRLAPYYDIAQTDLDGGHREYRIICTLKHILNETIWGQGVGICSTMETKYRYRKAYENTGNPVPKNYWKDRDASLIGGKGFSTKKIEGKWFIVQAVEREENPDIADTYNTVIKMAKKRAHVDAVLTATAASDIFTQDIGDDEEETGGKPTSGQSEKTAKPESPARQSEAAQGPPLAHPGVEGAAVTPAGDVPPPSAGSTPTERLLVRIAEHVESGKVTKANLTSYCHKNFCDKAHKEPVCDDVRKLDLLQLQAVSAWLTTV